jgi:hypothetical protein
MTRATEYAIADQVCCATPDRFEAGVMRCIGCGLFWETSDLNPPKCRLRDADDDALERSRD